MLCCMLYSVIGSNYSIYPVFSKNNPKSSISRILLPVLMPDSHFPLERRWTWALLCLFHTLMNQMAAGMGTEIWDISFKMWIAFFYVEKEWAILILLLVCRDYWLLIFTIIFYQTTLQSCLVRYAKGSCFILSSLWMGGHNQTWDDVERWWHFCSMCWWHEHHCFGL